MNYFVKGILQAVSLATLFVLPPLGDAATPGIDPLTCESDGSRIKGVTVAPRTTKKDFSGADIAANPQLFDPVPLIQTTIDVGGSGMSCVMAHFSVTANPADNVVVFQVLIDGVPMAGHALYPATQRSPQLTSPIVWVTQSDPDTSVQLAGLLGYNFVARVKPGMHTVTVKFAGCCSLFDPSPAPNFTEVLSAVLTLEYQGKNSGKKDDDDDHHHHHNYFPKGKW